MQVIEITSLNGHSPFDISICDLTLTYCYVVATGVVSVPPTLELPIPSQLEGASQVLVVVTDSIGCEEFLLESCPLPPTPTPTITPTPTPTMVIVCNCISFENTTSGTLNFSLTQCNGTILNGMVQSGTTLYYCGRLPSADIGVNVQISEICIDNTCAPIPTATPTATPTQTLAPIVGYFQDSCNPSNTFIVYNIPTSYSPLSGVYYVQSSGYVGCVTSISPITSTNQYSYILLNSQPDINTCQILNPCPTPTPTPTPTSTPTSTPTATPTPTPTPTNDLDCSFSVVPPTTINGIVVTESSTGSVITYVPTSTSCGITTPANSKWLGLGGAFTYTMNFSVPINNLIVFIVGTGENGTPAQENFIFTTNTGSGIPSISTTNSCYTTIVGNEIFSGGAPIGGGGGKFLITNSVNFTSVTISGNGGYLGSILSICANSIQPSPTATPTNTPTPTPTPQYRFLPNNLYFPDYSAYLVDSIDNSTSAYFYGYFSGYSVNDVVVPAGRIIKLNQDLSIDYSFTGGTGFIGYPYVYNGESILEQPDGKIIATGFFTSYSGVSKNRIVRLNVDGSIDNTFVVGSGFVGTPVPYTTVADIDSLGNIIVGGSFITYNGVTVPMSYLSKLSSGGTMDMTFSATTSFAAPYTIPQNVLINPDDSMYVTGYFTGFSGISANRIIKLQSNGYKDDSFNYGTGFNSIGENSINAFRISGETSFYVVGTNETYSGFSGFTTYNGTSVNRILKLMSDGTIDPSFNSGTGFSGGIVAAGAGGLSSYCRIIWTNKLLISGEFTSYNGTPSINWIILNSDGTVFQSFTTTYIIMFTIGNKLYGQTATDYLTLLMTYP